MIEAIANFVRLEFFFQVEMRPVAQSMPPGIGPARAGDRHALVGHFLNGIFQRPLRRGAIILALPADKRGAVIFDGQAIARHQEKQMPGGKAKPLSSSPASMTLPPARSTPARRKAPSPQAMVRSPDRILT